jgi:hypothetical protein
MTPMPDDGHIEHHKTLDYVEAVAGRPADGQFTAAWSDDGRSVTVSGPCPACGGQTATRFSVGIGGTKGFRDGRPPATREVPCPVTLLCECGYAHAHRPADAYDRGCGRYWPVYLPADQRRPPVPGSTAP